MGAPLQSAFETSGQEYGHSQALFGIVQGSVYPEIRKASAMALGELSFDGYAIGGVAVGEPFSEMCDTVSLCTEILPANKPRYLMGVGTPADLMEAISRGVDMLTACADAQREKRDAVHASRADDDDERKIQGGSRPCG
jgi:queuine tRNA-ribosyltransferase